MLLLWAGVRDPGIIPASYVSPDAKLNIGKKYRRIQSKEARVHYWINQSHHLHRLKWCESCNIFRPKGASHCNECNNCVAGFDHHCRWMGTCVGRRNYGQFLWLVIFEILTALFTMATCITHMIRNSIYKSDEEQLGAAVLNSTGILAFFAIIYSALVSLSKKCLHSSGCFPTFLATIFAS